MRRARERPGTELERAGRSADAEAQRLCAEGTEGQSEAQQWRKGAAGERRTAERLATLPPDYVVFHDLRVPGSRANIDHLVIGPTGVFVVDSKAYSGTFTDGSGTLWRGRNPINREVDTVQFIASRVSEHLDVPVRTVLCFTEANLPRPVTNLGITSAVTLEALSDVLMSGHRQHADPQIGWIARLASELTEPTTRPEPVVEPVPTITDLAPRGLAPARRRNAESAKRKRSKRSGRSIALQLAVIGFFVLVVLPALVTAVQPGGRGLGLESSTTVAPSPPSAPSPTPLSVPEPMVFSCPAPGSGYTGTLMWPGESNFGSYEIVVRWGGAEIYRQRWTYRSQRIPPLVGLFPGAPLVVSTERKFSGEPTPVAQAVVVPDSPC
ncbi:MAG: nuclease-related domain-containing protein [Microthrixaceae bacterium]